MGSATRYTFCPPREVMLGWFSKKSADATPYSTTQAQTPPASYAQWSQCLEALALGDNDEACLHQLQQGQLEWTGGVAPMFGKRISEEVQRRLKLCSTRLDRDLKAGFHESSLVRAILQARTQLHFVHRLIQLPVIPASTQQHLAEEIRKFAERAQKSLEDSSHTDRTGKLTSLLRHNPLTRYTDAVICTTAVDADTTPPPPQHLAPNGQRKRNILS